MTTFYIITIFPKIFDSYFNEGILRIAREKKLINVKIYNLRDYTDDARRAVDGRPFGGGPGMVLKVKPIFKAVEKIKKKGRLNKKNSKVILLAAKGKKFDQKKVRSLKKFKNIILICGRYEGIDERVKKNIADEEISIGDYVLSGGELGAMVVTETISRLIPGVLGNKESIEENRIKKIKTADGIRLVSNNLQVSLGYPVYTRPEVFEPKKGKKWRAPKVLLSGNHKKIEEWKKKYVKICPVKIRS